MGRGYFTSGFQPDPLDITFIAGSFENHSYPLIADLYDDGTNELILRQGQTIYLYNSKDLNIKDVITIDGITITFYVVADLDDNGHKELYVHSRNATGNEHNDLWKLEFNASGYNISKVITINSTGDAFKTSVATNNPQTGGVGCDDTLNKCFFLINQESGGVLGLAFNYTNFTTANEYGNFDATSAGAFPTVPYIPCEDIDNDGVVECAASYADCTVINSQELVMVEINSTLGVDVSWKKGISRGNICSSDGWSFGLSSPNFIELDAGNKEVAWAVAIDSDEYEILVYNTLGNLVDTFETGEGVIMSIPIAADIYEGADVTSACVLGFDENPAITDDPLSIFCGDLTLGRELQFNVNYDGYTNNLTKYAGFALFHTVETNGELSEDEFMTPYGVVETRTNGVCRLAGLLGLGECDADLAFYAGSVTDKQGYILPIDLENVGYFDYIHVEPTILRYVDDGIDNTPPFIYAYCMNPSNEQVFLTNTSVKIEVFSYDVDADDVNVTIQFYEGESFNQTTTPVSTGVEPFEYLDDAGSFYYSFSTFTANETGNNYKLNIIITDNGGLNNRTQEFDFSVSNIGTAEYGDNEKCVNFIDDIIDDLEDFETIGEGDECTTTADCEQGLFCNSANVCESLLGDSDSENKLNVGIREVAGEFGLSVGLIVLLFMILLNMAIIGGAISSSLPLTAIVPVGVAVNVLALIAFAISGLIDSGFIIVMLVLIGMFALWKIGGKFVNVGGGE